MDKDKKAQSPAPVSSQMGSPSVASAVHNVLHQSQIPVPAGIFGASSQQVHFQLQNSPYPPPDIVRAYEQIMPGAFDRIMKMAEQAQSDQFKLMQAANTAIQTDTKRGHYLGALVSIAAIIGAVVCAYLKQPWVSGVLVGVPVMAVARALIQSVRKPTAVAPAQLQVPIINLQQPNLNK